MAKAKKVVTLQDLQKGDRVYLYLFSGAAVGRGENSYEVASCNETKIVIKTLAKTSTFSRKTGVQLDAKNPRYANFITAMEDDQDAKDKARETIKANAAKNAPKTSKAVTPIEEIDESEFLDAAEGTKKVSAKAKAKPAPAKKAKKVAPVEEEFDDEDLDDEE